MERIHAHVLVSVAPSASGALQYVIENSGFNSVHVAVDFRQSSNIQLQFPRPNGHAETASKAVVMAFDTVVHPFQRRVMVLVVRQQRKRALVRVDYAVKEASAPSVEQVDQAQDAANAVLAQALLESQASYGGIRRSRGLHRASTQSIHTVENMALGGEINAFALRTQRRFVDEDFAPCSESLVAASDQDALWRVCTWSHVHDVVDESWSFWPKRSAARKSNVFNGEMPAIFKSVLPGQESFISALNVLSLQPQAFWGRLFPSLSDGVDILTLTSLCVRICEHGLQWRHVLLDLYLPSFPVGQGLMGVRNSEGELFGMLLQKTVAKLKGSYAAIARVSTITLLRELTGIPWIMAYDSKLPSAASHDQALQHLICSSVERYKRRLTQPTPTHVLPAILLSFGKLDEHICSFPVIDTVAKDALMLIPDDHGMVANFFGLSDKGGSSDADRTDPELLLRVPWSALFNADLRVFALLHDHQYEQRRRSKQWWHPHDSVGQHEYKFALSVASLSNIVILCGLSRPNDKGSISTAGFMEMKLEYVERDFSTTYHPIGKSERVESSSEGHRAQQTVVTLGAGEYILSVVIDGKRALDGEESKDHDMLLTVETLDENLHLLFECIDQGMDECITTDELATFFQLYEHQSSAWISSVQNGSQASRTGVLDTFLSHFASHNHNGTSVGLSSEDLLGVYRFLAARNDGNMVVNQQALKECIWSDLCLALGAQDATTAAKGHETQTTEIHMHDIEELLCTLHSDTPFLQFVALPSSP